MKTLFELVALLALVCGLAAGQENTDPSKQADPLKDVVILEIDFGDGSKRVYTQISWKPKLTILDAMNEVSKHSRGVKFEIKGTNSTAFLVGIDDLKNEGGGGRNWMFGVNGKKGNRSFAISELSRGDTVLWKFEPSR